MIHANILNLDFLWKHVNRSRHLFKGGRGTLPLELTIRRGCD